MAAPNEGDGRRDGPRTGTLAAWVWLALVAAAAILGMAFGIGPIAWIETWYAVQTGSLLSANVLFLLLVLVLPSIWVLFGAIDRADRKAAGDPARRRRQFGWWAAALLALSAGFLAMAIVAGLFAAQAPDGTEAAVPVTLPELERGRVPTGRVAITGARVETSQARFEQPQKGSSRRWRYTGFHPGATDKAVTAGALDVVAITLFLEGASGTGSFVRSPVERGPETVEGYLVENGLPAYARIVLEREGAVIASPHYLLRDGENGRRDGYYPLIFLGIIFGFTFGLIGALVLLMAKGAMPGATPSAHQGLDPGLSARSRSRRGRGRST
jgi:hypothetical protein